MTTEPNLSHSDDCAELRDLLPAFALGATTQAETARVQRLLVRCPDLAADLQDMLALADAIGKSVEPAAPPPALRSALLAQIAADATPAAETSPSPPVRVLDETVPRRPALRRPWWLLAAASLLLVLTNGFWAVQFQTLAQQLQAARDSERAIRDFVRSPALEIVRLQNQDETQVVATVLWDARDNVARLQASALPPVAADQTYQLWLIGADGPISAGLFQTDDQDAGELQFSATDPLTAYDAIGISIEPAGGSAAPSETPIAVGLVVTANSA